MMAQVASSDATQEMTETMDVYKSQVCVCGCGCVYVYKWLCMPVCVAVCVAVYMYMYMCGESLLTPSSFT